MLRFFIMKKNILARQKDMAAKLIDLRLFFSNFLEA